MGVGSLQKGESIPFLSLTHVMLSTLQEVPHRMPASPSWTSQMPEL
jgi:hypothetical protein